MSKDLMISMIRKGQNGNEILSILDVITGDSVTEEQESDNYPTIDPIDF